MAADDDVEGAASSDFFAVAHVGAAATLSTSSDGDLWPSAWADDGALYTACGDGTGFAQDDFADIVVNRIEGHPRTGLEGARLAAGREVSPVWTDPATFNSKPTGMVAVDGNGDGRDELYLAVQDLRCGESPDTFNTAPAAGIVCSEDYGRTWDQGSGVMFTGEFTTVMFLDFGQSNSGVSVLGDCEPMVYAYGLDHNWRTSYSGAVPDPVDLFLARVPARAVQDRDAWEFFAGHRADGRPMWSVHLQDRIAVLTDRRRTSRWPSLPGVSPRPDGTMIAQGGVVYNAGLRRYLYSSWTEYTFEFYEAPAPWGPWRHFLRRDFGPLSGWLGPKVDLAHHGGYATTIPSKFISSDGRDAWVQSNWFYRAGSYPGNSYQFSLRPLRLDPERQGAAQKHPSRTNLARIPGVHPIASASRNGRLEVLNDGTSARAEDSWNGLRQEQDWWGCTWPAPIRCNQVVLSTGPRDAGAGWFAQPPVVQVRRSGQWEHVPARISPPYPPDSTATGARRYTFDFGPQVTTGVRLCGPSGGWGGYTSVSEIEVYLREEASTGDDYGSIET